MNTPQVLPSIFLAIGLAASGYFIGHGITKHNQTSRIMVKGLAEREVPATIAIWTLIYSVNGDQLADLNARLRESTTAVLDFLKTAGFDPADASLQPPTIQDHNTERRDKDVQPPPSRFTATQSILVRTKKVDRIKPALSSATQLMEKASS